MLEECDYLCSNDVVSAFTNSPWVPSEILEKDKTLKQQTQLVVDGMMELLEFALTTTYFMFRGDIHHCNGQSSRTEIYVH